MFAEGHAAGTSPQQRKGGTMKVSVGVAILVVILLIVFVL
jgi:hypothetical protein